jgi:hypothetical protein
MLQRAQGMGHGAEGWGQVFDLRTSPPAGWQGLLSVSSRKARLTIADFQPRFFALFGKLSVARDSPIIHTLAPDF